MRKLSIAAPSLDANPMVVMKLLRAIGGKVRTIAELLSRQAPLFDEEFPDRPDVSQIVRIRQLMEVLEHAATRPRIVLDGREITAPALNELIENAERMLMGTSGGQ